MWSDVIIYTHLGSIFQNNIKDSIVFSFIIQSLQVTILYHLKKKFFLTFYLYFITVVSYFTPCHFQHTNKYDMQVAELEEKEINFFILILLIISYFL